MKIAITGAAGFVGSNLFNSYEGSGNVFGIDNLQFGYEDNCEYDIYVGEFLDFDLKNIDVLCHLATANIIYAIDNPIETFRTNALKTIELFDRFKGKIVYTSTASVYGNASGLPTKEAAPIQVSNAYDMSKHIAEQYLRKRGNYTTLRLSNVYGKNQRADHPYSGVIGKFTGADVLTIYGDGEATRDYTNVVDVVRAIRMAVEQPAKNTEINIASGVETSINQIASYFDKPRTYKTGRAIDKIDRRCLDTSRAKELLGWEYDNMLYNINNYLESL
jgi:UDP-glucose 4-epimerase